MAFIVKRNNNYHIVFNYGTKKYTRSLKTSKRFEAKARLQRLEENIRLVESGRLEIPTTANPATFLLSDGKLQSNDVPIAEPLTLKSLFDGFFDSLPDDSLEESTRKMMQIHVRHLIKFFRAGFVVNDLGFESLQNYVNKRARQKTKWKTNISADTIQKELTTFSAAWRWAMKVGRLACPFPRDGLRLPKTHEKPPFQTWDEIERQISQNGLSDRAARELWKCLYLRREEIDQLLIEVQAQARHGFIYPMILMAAHTGARRSELLRSLKADVDFESGILTVREKKRIRGKFTTRRVPMSKQLLEVMRQWFKDHPGGIHTFCHPGSIPRSNCGRGTSLSESQAHKHFTNTLKHTRWEKVDGWHCLRHSFISNLACKGVDQRFIDEIAGHTTEAMRRRYRHLFPDVKKSAIDDVFG